VKKIRQRFLFVFALFMWMIALPRGSQAQQPDQEPTPSTPHQNDAQPTQQPQNEAHMPASGHSTTQPEKTFAGHIVVENGSVVLKDPVSKVSYKLSDPAKAKQFEGKEVKVTGKLEANSSTIQVSQIEPVR
jgi:uncharacterized protein involved in outer membrane biogenesis